MYGFNRKSNPYRDWPSWYMERRQSSLCSAGSSTKVTLLLFGTAQQRGRDSPNQGQLTSAAALSRARIRQCQTKTELPKSSFWLHPLQSEHTGYASFLGQGPMLSIFPKDRHFTAHRHWRGQLAPSGHAWSKQDRDTDCTRGIWVPHPTAFQKHLPQQALGKPCGAQSMIQCQFQPAKLKCCLTLCVTCTALRAAGVQWSCPARHCLPS